MQDFGKPADLAFEARLAQLDTLRYRVHAHTTLPGQRTRVAVTLKTLHSPQHQGDESLHARLRRVLAHFFPAAWTLFLVGRSIDDEGVEALTYRASAALPKDAPTDLPALARAASTETVALLGPEISMTVDLDDYRRRIGALKQEALRAVVREREALAAASGRQWEIRDIQTRCASLPGCPGISTPASGFDACSVEDGVSLVLEVTLGADSPVLH
ncbi:MAG: hypothetical protein FJ164_11730 [Gammaproteobacteria bacterium]|nr:hypothetical protein [Gammaproteobacteria bacterium]